MMEHLIEVYLPHVIAFIEILGIIILTYGVIKSFCFWLCAEVAKKNLKAAKPLTKAMATALEFLMAAEILKTALLHDYKSILTIAGIILLRASFVFLLHYEVKHESDLEDEEENSLT